MRRFFSVFRYFSPCSGAETPPGALSTEIMRKNLQILSTETLIVLWNLRVERVAPGARCRPSDASARRGDVSGVSDVSIHPKGRQRTRGRSPVLLRSLTPAATATIATRRRRHRPRLGSPRHGDARLGTVAAAVPLTSSVRGGHRVATARRHARGHRHHRYYHDLLHACTDTTMSCIMKRMEN